MQTAPLPLGVRPDNRPRLLFQELDELRGGAAEEFGGRAGLETGDGQHVERLGQQGGKIFMPGVQFDPPPAATRLP